MCLSAARAYMALSSLNGSQAFSIFHPSLFQVLCFLLSIYCHFALLNYNFFMNYFRGLWTLCVWYIDCWFSMVFVVQVLEQLQKHSNLKVKENVMRLGNKKSNLHVLNEQVYQLLLEIFGNIQIFNVYWIQRKKKINKFGMFKIFFKKFSVLIFLI